MADDFDLIKEVLRGSRGAMETLIRKHYSLVYAYVYRRIGERHAAYDVTQDVFIRVVKAIKGYRHQGDFRTWLLTIATNLCRDYFRLRHRRVAWADEVDVGTIASPEEQGVSFLFEKYEKRESVKEALAVLPDMQREALVLRFYHDLKITDIAQVTGTNESTVKSRLRQGIAKLKGYLERGDDRETQG